MIDSRLLPCAHCKCPHIDFQKHSWQDEDGLNWHQNFVRCSECPAEMMSTDGEEQVISKWNTRGGVLQAIVKSVTFKYTESKTWHCFKNDHIEMAFADMKNAFAGLTKYLESGNLLGTVKVVATPEDGISPIEFLTRAMHKSFCNEECYLTFNISFV